MKLSFGLKLGIVTCLLSVTLTSLGVYFFYVSTYQTMMLQMGKTLKDIGRVGLFLFDRETCDAIKRLKIAAEKEPQVTTAQLEQIPVGGTMNSLSAATISKLETSADFLLVRKKLRMIGAASSIDFERIWPGLDIVQDDYQLDNPITLMQNGAVGPYLLVETKLSPDRMVMAFLVSSANDPAPDGWAGNHIGNLYRANFSMKDLFEGRSILFQQLLTDEFYTCLTTNIPLIDEHGQTIAVLGLDYAAGKELAKLEHLALICFGLIGASFFLAIIVSYFAARALNRPLVELHAAAVKVAQQDYSAKVTINSKDEFGVLGQVFNQMVASIRNSFKTLELKNKQLSSVVCDMHDGVGSILTSIALSSEQKKHPGKADDRLPPINRLARQGLTEVRMLMDAMEYEVCDLSSLADELEMLAADILKPAGVILCLNLPQRLPEHAITFAAFLDLQRLFREAFTNIIKHASADQCTVGIRFDDKWYQIQIKDNGQARKQIGDSAGRGLASMANRISRLGGTLTYRFEDGFVLEIELPREGL